MSTRFKFKANKGIIDPISIFVGLFLVVALVVSTVVVKDKKFSLNINEKAAAPKPIDGEAGINNWVNPKPAVTNPVVNKPVNNNLEEEEVGYIQQVITAPVVINGTVVSPATSKPVVNEPEVVTPVVPVVVPTPVVQQKTCDANGNQYQLGAVVVGGTSGSNNGYAKCTDSGWVGNCAGPNDPIKLCGITDLTPDLAPIPQYLQPQYNQAMQALLATQNQQQNNSEVGLTQNTNQTSSTTQSSTTQNNKVYTKSNCDNSCGNQTCVLIGYGYYGCQATSTITKYTDANCSGTCATNQTCEKSGDKYVCKTVAYVPYTPQQQSNTATNPCPAGSTWQNNTCVTNQQNITNVENQIAALPKNDISGQVWNNISSGATSLVTNYIQSYAPENVYYVWKENGYTSPQECQQDMIQKNPNYAGIQAASSCNTYKLTKDQAISSIKLGTTIAEVITLPAASVIEGGTLATTLGIFGATSTVNQTSNAAIAHIEDPGSTNAWKETFIAALGWANLGSADYLLEAFGSTGTAATQQTARLINTAVSGTNLAVDSANTYHVCTQEEATLGQCLMTGSSVALDLAFGLLDIKQGQLGFGNPTTILNESAAAAGNILDQIPTIPETIGGINFNQKEINNAFFDPTGTALDIGATPNEYTIADSGFGALGFNPNHQFSDPNPTSVKISAYIQDTLGINPSFGTLSPDGLIQRSIDNTLESIVSIAPIGNPIPNTLDTFIPQVRSTNEIATNMLFAPQERPANLLEAAGSGISNWWNNTLDSFAINNRTGIETGPRVYDVNTQGMPQAVDISISSPTTPNILTRIQDNVGSWWSQNVGDLNFNGLQSENAPTAPRQTASEWINDTFIQPVVNIFNDVGQPQLSVSDTQTTMLFAPQERPANLLEAAGSRISNWWNNTLDNIAGKVDITGDLNRTAINTQAEPSAKQSLSSWVNDNILQPVVNRFNNSNQPTLSNLDTQPTVKLTPEEDLVMPEELLNSNIDHANPKFTETNAAINQDLPAKAGVKTNTTKEDINFDVPNPIKTITDLSPFTYIAGVGTLTLLPTVVFIDNYFDLGIQDKILGILEKPKISNSIGQKSLSNNIVSQTETINQQNVLIDLNNSNQLENSKFVDNRFYMQEDPDLKDFQIQTEFGPRPFRLVGCGPTATANIVNNILGLNITPIDIVNKMDSKNWGYNGTYLYEDGSLTDILSEYNLKSELYNKSFYNMPKYINSGSQILIGGNFRYQGRDIGHISYIEFNGDIKNITLKDNLFGENMICEVVGDANLSCTNGQNKVSINLESSPVYIVTKP